MLVSLIAHLLIWLGNGFAAGNYPALAQLITTPEHTLKTGPLWLLMLWNLALIMALFHILSRTRQDHPLLHFARQPRFWYGALLTGCTTGLFISQAMPLTVSLAGPLAPAIIECCNLATVYLFTLLTMTNRFTKNQIRQQLIWLAALIGGTSTFIILVNSQQTGNLTFAGIGSLLQNPLLPLAFAISLIGHLVLWAGVFFTMGHFPKVQNIVYGDTTAGPPRWPAYAIALTALAGYGWLCFAGGAWIVYPAPVAQLLTSPAYHVQLLVYFLAFNLLINLLMPLMVQLAKAHTPIVIGTTNIMVMFGLITLANPAVSFSLTSLTALVVLTLTAVGFAQVLQKHQTEAAG
ncbi:MAG: hypothetical protein EBQ80_04395 [Proteobacteria bacterium]|nr:hypothetical protein [Pseudomonadota bacterium]